MPWPNTQFEIVRTVVGNHLVGVFCQGEKLEPRRVIAMEECQDDIVWADREELVDGDLEQFANSTLRRS
jgi:hypothetical protein